MNPRSHSRANQSPGFSLVEVLVATALFGIAVAAMFSACVNALWILDRVSDDKSYDPDFRFVARQILQIGDKEDLEDGGEIETLNGGEAEWEVELTETRILDLWVLDLTVTFPEADPAIEPFAEQFHILRPGWMEEADYDNLLQEKTEELESRRAQYGL